MIHGWIVSAFGVLFLLPSSHAQTPPVLETQAASKNVKPGDDYKQERAFATQLFEKRYHMEALPLFEDLAMRNPTDSGVLLGLGACLVDHSATVTDPEAAKRERIRARNILMSAKELGNDSILLNNLLDLLPADGSTRYPGNPDVVKAIEAGEAAFARNDYAEAITHYSKALELDPKNYVAALFIADCYFGQKDFAKAAQGYEHAIQINPDAETAYRYESDMFTKNGDQQKARQLAIQAVVAEPYSQVAWRGVLQWANANHLKLIPVRINTHSSFSTDGSGKTTINVDPNTSPTAMAVWLAYNGARLNWHKEEFKKNYPQEAEYRHTLAEEVAALSLAATMLSSQKAAGIAADPDLSLLKKIADAKMLEPYVLLSAADEGIAVDYVGYREKNRANLGQYLSTFAIPPAPSKP